MDKFRKIVLLLALSLTLAACAGNPKSEGESVNPNISLEELADKLYEGASEDILPGVFTQELDEETLEFFVGTSDIEFEEAIASEAQISSIAHSLVLIKLKDGQDVDKVKSEIKANLDPRKWICVEAEEVVVESNGNIILALMTNDDLADHIVENFN